MTNLSPAAYAILTAYRDQSWTPDEEDNGRFYKFSHRAGMAAALRAAADQVENVHPARPSTEWGEGWVEGVQDVVAGFHRIADELDGGAR